VKNRGETAGKLRITKCAYVSFIADSGLIRVNWSVPAEATIGVIELSESGCQLGHAKRGLDWLSTDRQPNPSPMNVETKITDTIFLGR